MNGPQRGAREHHGGRRHPAHLPELSRPRTRRGHGSRLINTLDPYGTGNFGATGLFAKFEFDTRETVPDAKMEERYTVTITAIRENQYSGDMQASCTFALIDGDREGMCLPAP